MPEATPDLVQKARRLYAEQVARGLADLRQAAIAGARQLVDQPGGYIQQIARRDLLQALVRADDAWTQAMTTGLRRALMEAGTSSGPQESRFGALSLVDDETIEREILSARLSQAILDRASGPRENVTARILNLTGRSDLEPNDLFRPAVFARLMVDAWRFCDFSLEGWRDLSEVLHEHMAQLVHVAYREADVWLEAQGVMPKEAQWKQPGRAAGPGASARKPTPQAEPARAAVDGSASSQNTLPASELQGVIQAVSLSAAIADRATSLLDRFNRLVARHVPAFDQGNWPQKPSPALAEALKPTVVPTMPDGSAAVSTLAQTVPDRPGLADRPTEPQATLPVILGQMRQRRDQLKSVAATPQERAIIEIVDLLFQSILSEDRIPPAIRVWIARLQMPVLRVAVSEPEFFVAADHPARKLIDRIGSCVLGFEGNAVSVTEELEREIRRIVQVVEAYPDTGRRVFQTVLNEFEKFLEHYLPNQNENTRHAVSIAQQVEQRETLAIQYTIELRRMLEGVPVQEGLRKFLFQHWADVMAITALRHGQQGQQTQAAKRVAADLIWAASAKVTRDERAEVIRRLPNLLKTLREGLAEAGMDPAEQEAQVQTLNDALAAAFTAKAAPIPRERIGELVKRLETLDELLPELDDMSIDDSIVLDISGHADDRLEVVPEGGMPPTAATLDLMGQLQVGGWFLFTFRGRSEPIQLAWQGLRKQLSLFVAASGRSVLFQQQRLAAYLESGELKLAEEESLTLRATRTAMAHLDEDASALKT